MTSETMEAGPATRHVIVPGHDGERDFDIEWQPCGLLTLCLTGWTHDEINIDERQIAVLRDTLSAWFPTTP